MGLSIIKATEHWIAVDKQSGISVHNDPGNDALSELLKRRITGFHPVHRLDKETSGILLFARGKAIAELQFQWNNVQKIYRAIVRGQISHDEGVWEYSLTDRSEGRRQPRGRGRDRKYAKSTFKCLRRTPYFSFIEVKLHSGRQHQIRKHTAIAGHEIIG